MAKKSVSAAPVLSDAEKQIADKFNIPVGPNRYSFLDRFPLVRKGLDTYVTICAIRLKVTDLSDDLLPEDEVINLPGNEAFLRTYFGKDRFADFKQLVRAADRVSRRVATMSAAAAIRGSQIIHTGQLGGDSKARERLISAYQTFVIILFNLILFINRRGELNLKEERARIKNEYVHQPIYKDILSLLISFDSRSHALNTMLNGNDHGTFTDLIEELGMQAQQVHAKILEACVALEITIHNCLTDDSRVTDDFNRRIISVALDTQEMLDKQRPPDPTIPLQAASEIVEYLSPKNRSRVHLNPVQTEEDELVQEPDYQEPQRRKA